MNKIAWDSLPHDNQVGHGHEGLVLRLNDSECIKIYSPQRTANAETEFGNYQILRDAGLRVPEPIDLVEVVIGGKDVKLPTVCEFFGITLSTFRDVQSVPGIVKTYFPGVVYGTKNPTVRELRDLLDFFQQLRDANYAFHDPALWDFIATPDGAALVDCSDLFDLSNPTKEGAVPYTSEKFEERVLWDFPQELRNHDCISWTFEWKMLLAKCLTR